MKHYVKYNGKTVVVDFPCVIENNKTYVFVETDHTFQEHYLSVYYRHERTWDDHLGNTPCGYYCNVPMPDGKKKRVYMFN